MIVAISRLDRSNCWEPVHMQFGNECIHSCAMRCALSSVPQLQPLFMLMGNPPFCRFMGRGTASRLWSGMRWQGNQPRQLRWSSAVAVCFAECLFLSFLVLCRSPAVPCTGLLQAMVWQSYQRRNTSLQEYRMKHAHHLCVFALIVWTGAVHC